MVYPSCLSGLETAGTLLLKYGWNVAEKLIFLRVPTVLSVELILPT